MSCICHYGTFVNNILHEFSAKFHRLTSKKFLLHRKKIENTIIKFFCILSLTHIHTHLEKFGFLKTFLLFLYNFF